MPKALDTLRGSLLILLHDLDVVAVGILEERDAPAVGEIDLPELQSHTLELGLHGIVVVDAVGCVVPPALGWFSRFVGSLDEL